MSVRLRAARLEDAEALRRVHRSAVQGLAARHYDARQRRVWTSTPVEAVRKAMGTMAFFVAERRGGIVGFSALMGARVKMVYVAASEAGKGTGRLLLRKVEALAKRRGVKRLRLEASLNAVGFYVRNGWKEGRKYNHPLKGVRMDCVKMTKAL